MSAARRWLETDLDGLAQTLYRKGDGDKNDFAWLLYELLQNCWDTAATRVDVTVIAVEGRPQVALSVVDDNPNGFRNLTHSYTLYAPSEKKSDPLKRGRFNVGEKMVLAFCTEAEVRSTTGAVLFRADGTRTHGIKKRDAGTSFVGTLRMTRSEMEGMLEGAKRLLPPIPTYINGERLSVRSPKHTFTTTLPTEIADDEGNLRRSARQTAVRVYDLAHGERGRIYEMGIPIVETGDPWHVEVMQKVPQNADRDNVTPAYLRELRVAVVNATYATMAPAEATTVAVQDALGDKRIEVAAVQTIITHQQGPNRVVAVPRDREANNKAAAHGFTVIQGSAYSAEQWDQIRRAQAVPPSTHRFATRQIYSDDPNAPPAEIIPEEDWTDGMKNIAEYAVELGWKLMRRSIAVRFESRFGAIDAANYGRGGRLCFNIGRLGRKWFDQGSSVAVDELLIHEFAHETESNHLSSEFHEACCALGAKLKELALTDPGLFVKYGWKARARA